MRRLVLPALLVGHLPTIRDVQRMAALSRKDAGPERLAALFDEAIGGDRPHG